MNNHLHRLVLLPHQSHKFYEPRQEKEKKVSVKKRKQHHWSHANHTKSKERAVPEETTRYDTYEVEPAAGMMINWFIHWVHIFPGSHELQQESKMDGTIIPVCLSLQNHWQTQHFSQDLDQSVIHFVLRTRKETTRSTLVLLLLCISDG